VASSSLSTLTFWRHVTLAAPMSPEVENFTPSLVTEMVTVSPMELRSRQIRCAMVSRQGQYGGVGGVRRVCRCVTVPRVLYTHRVRDA
jgi:hypothetical protein